MLVHFPVALFSTAVLCDTLLLLRYRVVWIDRMAVVLYALATLGASAAAVSGKLSANALESYLEEESQSHVAAHGDWAFFAVVLFFIVSGLRFEALWRDRGQDLIRIRRVRIAAFAVALTAAVVLFGTAMRGGELVYRYGVGVSGRAGPNGR